MKRLDGETYDEYRARRKQEMTEARAHMKGTLVHCSSQVVETQPGVFRKYVAGGTYRKPRKA